MAAIAGIAYAHRLSSSGACTGARRNAQLKATLFEPLPFHRSSPKGGYHDRTLRRIPRLLGLIDKFAKCQERIAWNPYSVLIDVFCGLSIRIEHPFEVHAKWGNFIGKKGDLLLKKYEERAVAFPEDVWIVDSVLFRQTYENVADGK